MEAADFTAKPNPQEPDAMQTAAKLSVLCSTLADLVNSSEGRKMLDSTLRNTAASVLKVHILLLILLIFNILILNLILFQTNVMLEKMTTAAPRDHGAAPPPSPASSLSNVLELNQVHRFSSSSSSLSQVPKKTAKKETAKRSNTDTEVQQRAKKTKTLQSGDYEKTKEYEKAKEEYNKAQEKFSKAQEKLLKETLQSGDNEKTKEDRIKTKKKSEEMIKTMPLEEVPIPLLLIVIIMNFIITSSSSDLAAHLHQDLAEGEPQQD